VLVISLVLTACSNPPHPYVHNVPHFVAYDNSCKRIPPKFHLLTLFPTSSFGFVPGGERARCTFVNMCKFVANSPRNHYALYFANTAKFVPLILQLCKKCTQGLFFAHCALLHIPMVVWRKSQEYVGGRQQRSNSFNNVEIFTASVQIA
jgi:hypothetical protein